jgi:hypothetical protein
MNRRSIISSSAAVLGLALLSDSVVGQQKSLKDQLVGTWTLVSWERVLPNGSKIHSYGDNPKGVATFEPNGRMFLMFARPDLPKIASNVPQTATAEEAKAVVAGTLAYYGTYTVDDASKALNLRLEASTFPNQVGSEQKRTIAALTADEFKYDTAALNGDKISVTFRRAK